MRSKTLGFTLIELMITVAVVAILAAVVFPSYQNHVRKSRRAEAQAYMMAVAARQQQILVDTRSYATSMSNIDVAVPNNVALAYVTTLEDSTATTFTLKLAPSSSQSSEPCGTLTITH